MSPYVFVIKIPNPDTGEPVIVVPSLRDVVIFAKENNLSVYSVSAIAHYPNGTFNRVDLDWWSSSGFVQVSLISGVARYDWK